MQVPACTNVTVDPDTVQTPVVPELNVTGLPEPPPVADTVYVPPNVGSVGEDVNVIVCDAWATVTGALATEVAVQVR